MLSLFFVFGRGDLDYEDSIYLDGTSVERRELFLLAELIDELCVI